MKIPDRVIERLAAYRRHLRDLAGGGADRIYSHELASLAGATPAQVRRDLMTVNYTGSPARGYDVAGLVEHIGNLLNPGEATRIVIVGVGHVGGAVLDYFGGRHPEYSVVGTFDTHPDRVGRVVHGHRCYPVDELEEVLRGQHAVAGIIAVPAEAAQEVANRLIRAGVTGLLNFAPVRLRVPEHVYVENVDIALALEKVVFFARARMDRREA